MGSQSALIYILRVLIVLLCCMAVAALPLEHVQFEELVGEQCTVLM